MAPALNGLIPLNLSQHMPRTSMAWLSHAYLFHLPQLLHMLGLLNMLAVALVMGCLLPCHVSLSLAATALSLPALRSLLLALGLTPPAALLTSSQRVPVATGRMAAQIEGDFLVLIIGLRLNMGVHASLLDTKWAGEAMEGMLKELQEVGPEQGGCLGAWEFVGTSADGPSQMIVQYWRSLDHMLRFTHSPARKHLPAWKLLQEIGRKDANLGFWHESFLVRAGEYESIYVNCPPMMLGGCAGVKLVPAEGRMATATGRLGVMKAAEPAPEIEAAETEAPTGMAYKAEADVRVGQAEEQEGGVK